MTQNTTSDMVNLAHQVINQTPNSHIFFSNQQNYEHIYPFSEADDLYHQLLMNFYNATHTTLESYQSLLEVQAKINEDTERLTELKKGAADSKLVSDLELQLSQNLVRIKRFESEIKKANADLLKILSVDFVEKKAITISNLKFRAGLCLGLCVMLAGLAALSYFSPAAIAGIMAFVVGGIPCLFSFAAMLLAACTGAFLFLVPVVWYVFGVASLCLTIKTYEGVYSAAPIFGHVFAAMTAICLALAIKFGIDALVLKCTNPEDFIKQNIQTEIEKHISLFQQSINSQMEKNNNDDSVNIPNDRPLAI